jgi:CRP-like cAMP-binding protein
MSLSEEFEVLKSIPMFAKVAPAQLKLLAFTSERLEFADGQNIFRSGDPGDAAFIIIDGTARVLVERGGEELEVATVGRNELLGEIALLTNVPRTATVRAASPLTALKIPKELFLRLMAEFPDMAIEVMAELARRLDRTTQQLTAALAQ